MSRVACRSGWWRRSFWRSRTGSGMRWSRTCAAPSPAMAARCPPPSMAGASPRPPKSNGPDFIGHVDGRLDVSNDTDIAAQLRLTVATDNPGSPNVQAGLASYPIYTTAGSTIGFDQRFNRLTVSAGATIDRTDYQNSKLTDGEITSNGDRNFTQYGGGGGVCFEGVPGVTP